MAKGMGCPPPAQFPGLTNPGIPVAKHVLRATLGGVTLGYKRFQAIPATPDFFFLTTWVLSVMGQPQILPKTPVLPWMMNWGGHMQFAQMVCWSLSGPGPVVLQVRPSPLVVFSQMTKNNCAVLSLILWNRSSSKACHIPRVTQCSFEKYMKKMELFKYHLRFGRFSMKLIEMQIPTPWPNVL